MIDSLLAHVVSRFSARQWEDIATESLRYLLDGHADAQPVQQPSRHTSAGSPTTSQSWTRGTSLLAHWLTSSPADSFRQ